jgi:hypothetical protein
MDDSCAAAKDSIGDQSCSLTERNTMYGKVETYLENKIAEIEDAGLYKRERILAGPQQAIVSIADGAPASW